jgi:hypothetical protein
MLVAEYVQRNAPFMRPTPVLKQIYTLPGSERHSAVDHGDRQLDLRERRSQVRRHIVGAFVVVIVEARVLRCDSLEECFQVRTYFRRGVLLDEKGSRCVGTEYRHQSVTNGLISQPGLHGARDVDQAAARRAYRQESACLLHAGILEHIISSTTCRGAARLWEISRRGPVGGPTTPLKTNTTPRYRTSSAAPESHTRRRPHWAAGWPCPR